MIQWILTFIDTLNVSALSISSDIFLILFRVDTKAHYTIELTEKSRPVSSGIAHSEKDPYDPYKNRQVEHPTTWVFIQCLNWIDWLVRTRECVIWHFSHSNSIHMHIYRHDILTIIITHTKNEDWKEFRILIHAGMIHADMIVAFQLLNYYANSLLLIIHRYNM